MATGNKNVQVENWFIKTIKARAQLRLFQDSYVVNLRLFWTSQRLRQKLAELWFMFSENKFFTINYISDAEKFSE